MNVADLLRDKTICVCAGAGGVGKTTTSASIAVGMAAAGQKVAVLTIDPAKRLANALGLPELGNEERLVDPKLFARSGVKMKGELWAMMLDPKRTFDELVRRHAPDAESRDRILGNRIYRELSTAVAGSQEYAAMEKLYELHYQDRYDLLVLDTPPTRNALDFLDAPERMSRFFNSRSLQMFLKPGAFGMRAVGKGGGLVGSALKRMTGIDLLKDLSEFFQSLGGMAEGFSDRAQKVNRLLGEKETSFLLVTAPEREPIDEAVYFWERLREAGLQFGGVVVNKVHYDYIEHAENQARRSTEDLLVEATRIVDRSLGPSGHDSDLARRVIANFHDYEVLADRDRRNISRLMERVDAQRVIRIPFFDEDVHDLSGLVHMNRFLFASRKKRGQIFAAVDQ